VSARRMVLSVATQFETAPARSSASALVSGNKDAVWLSSQGPRKTMGQMHLTLVTWQLFPLRVNRA
jgi:hypothetical protein